MSPRIAIPVAALGAALWALAALGACVLLLIAGVARIPASIAGGRSVTYGSTPAPASAPSGAALADIPTAYLALYRAAAARFGLDWTVLAGIGRVECDHGRDPDPSCTVDGHFNYAGAGGPAQFLLSTWREYGISASGHGVPDMWKPADAILSMANYLHAAGAPGNYPQAIYAYNHAWWYVADVLAWASRYRGDIGGRRTPSSPVTTNNAAAFSGAASPAITYVPSDVITRSAPEGSA